jgi:hypothetical protein
LARVATGDELADAGQIGTLFGGDVEAGEDALSVLEDVDVESDWGGGMMMLMMMMVTGCRGRGRGRGCCGFGRPEVGLMDLL